MCNGKEVVFSTSASAISFIYPKKENVKESEDEIKPHDIDGNGSPDLIIQETNGNCCLDYTIISLEENFQEYKIKNAGPDFELVDLNNDGKYEIKTTDTSVPLYDFFGEIVYSPQIILESQDGRYKFSQKFMKNVPSVKISNRIAKTKKEIAATGKTPPLDRTFIINLIYQGQGNDALEFLNAVYDRSSGEESKNEMVDEIFETIQDSPHWEEIKIMNKWKYEFTGVCEE